MNWNYRPVHGAGFPSCNWYAHGLYDGNFATYWCVELKNREENQPPYYVYAEYRPVNASNEGGPIFGRHDSGNLFSGTLEECKKFVEKMHELD